MLLLASMPVEQDVETELDLRHLLGPHFDRVETLGLILKEDWLSN